jgi:TIR domain
MVAMRLFLSYDSRDSHFAKELLPRLLAQKLEVWDPARELYPGSNWLLEAGRAFERADAVIFLISEHSVDTPALRHEVQYAISNLRFKDRVVPVILSRGMKNIPWILEKMSVIDATDHDMDRVAKLVATAMPNSKMKGSRTQRARSGKARSKRPALGKNSATRASRTRH